jgi:anti-anti-sigma factor
MFQIASRELALENAGFPPVTVIEVTGEIDATNAAQFTRAIDGTPGRRPLVVDLSGLDYINSAGFAAIDQLLSRQVITIVVDPHSPIRAAAKLIEMPCRDSVEDAVRALRSAAPPA